MWPKFSRAFPRSVDNGAPKRAALEVIDDLEEEPREIYTGAVGRIKPSGATCFNVAIRTAGVQPLPAIVVSARAAALFGTLILLKSLKS